MYLDTRVLWIGGALKIVVLYIPTYIDCISSITIMHMRAQVLPPLSCQVIKRVNGYIWILVSIIQLLSASLPRNVKAAASRCRKCIILSNSNNA
ncbi:hypothetical protein F4814DRAFT_9946 [Daldinia grandis]|nr:hypothetical protein F4814DRAFT_9946 [Daldinia grandis]